MKKTLILSALVASTVMGTQVVRADDIAATAIKAGTFKTLVAAAKAAGLVPMLANDKSLTVFAPTDAAFAKLPKGTVENLLKPENKETLKKILAYHVVIGRVPASAVVKMSSGANVKTASGEKVILRLSNGVMLDPGMGMKAKVTKTDIKADNGIIHVIDTVLIPPSVQKAMMGAG